MARVVIVGPGAMGQMHAALLARAGVDVALLDHDEARAARLAAEGVRVAEQSGTGVVSVPCSARAEELAPVSFVVIFTKAYATAAAVRGSLAAAGPDTVWVTLQNGLGNVEALREAAGDVRLLAGVTSSGAHVLADGAVRVVAVGQAQVGPLAPALAADAASFCDLLSGAGLPARAVDDPWPAIWRKLVINAAVNPVAGLAGRRNGDLVELPWLRRLSGEVAREVARVALARGVNLDLADPAALVEEVCRATADNRCSMLQDLDAGRRTEIDHINGAVADLAPPEAPAPLCAALAALVRLAEAGAGQL